VKNIKRVAAATAITAAGLGLAALGTVTVAGAQPGPFPDYHWCPGEWWDPGWGNNWDMGRCHDDGFFDGEPRDEGHWHGQGPWRPEGPGGRGGGWGPREGRGW
jgi:hypothetical protein